MTSMGYLDQQIKPTNIISHHIFHKDDWVSHEISMRSLLKHNFLQLKYIKAMKFTLGARFRNMDPSAFSELPTVFFFYLR